MIYFSAFQPAVVALFTLLGLWCVMARRPDLLLGLAMASLGFGGFWIFALGTIWLPIKVVGMWSLVYVIFVSPSSMANIHGTVARLLGAFCAWVLLECALGYLLPLPAGAYSTEGTQGVALRPAVQLITYISTLAFVPLASAAFRIRGALDRILGIYAFAAVIVCVAGIYQLVALKLGLEFMPIYRIHGNHDQLAAFNLGGVTITRIYSFSGEPKHLGMFLAPFAMIQAVLFLEKRNIYPVWWNRRPLLGLTMFVAVMTYSTAVLLAIAIAVSANVLIVIRRGPRMLVLGVACILALATAVIPSGSPSGSGEPQIVDVIRSRTIGRIGDEAGDRYEASALRLIAVENPLNIPVGFGLGMYSYLLEGLFYGSTVEPINSGWIVLLMDTGAVGVVLLLSILFQAGRSALRAARRSAGVSSILIRASLGALLASSGLFLGTNALPQVMIWLGSTIALAGLASFGDAFNSRAASRQVPSILSPRPVIAESHSVTE